MSFGSNYLLSSHRAQPTPLLKPINHLVHRLSVLLMHPARYKRVGTLLKLMARGVG